MAAEPIVHGLETELAGQLVVLRVDVNSPAGRELTSEYDSRVTPTFIFFTPDGEEAWRQFGSLDADRVRGDVSGG
ncbi:MAG: thioredoxin family protein [Anaerolineales bacterium]